MFTSTSAFELDENATLNCKTKFRCQSVWVNLVRYTKKIGVNLGLQDNKVVVLKNGTVGKPAPMLQKALYNHCINNLLKKATDLSIQGGFFTLQSINRNCSNSYSTGISVMHTYICCES